MRKSQYPNRLIVRLDDETLRLLNRLEEESRLSKSEIVRQALRNLVATGTGEVGMPVPVLESMDKEFMQSVAEQLKSMAARIERST